MNSTEELIRKNIGKKIKLARNKNNYTQEKLAEKLSLSTRYISQLERGIAFGSATTIVNICKTLNISSNFLFDDVTCSSNSCFNELVDSSFLDSYVQLSNVNKNIITVLTTELVKMQKDERKT